MEEKLTVLTLGGANTLVIRKTTDSRFFITTDDSIIISRDALITLLNFLVSNGFLHPKVLHGILEQTNTE
jgi:hypothetical protein